MKKLLIAGAVVAALYIGISLWLTPPTGPDKVIFHGGPIVTMEDAAPTVEALLVEDGIITGLGSLADMQAQSPGASLHNLRDNTLMPGLIEPHSHPIAAAQFAATIDVSGFTHNSRAAVMQTLRDSVDDTATPWALAFGWDPVMVDDLEAPTLAELDALSPEKPLLILTQMMHDAYANSAALEAAGLTDRFITAAIGTALVLLLGLFIFIFQLVYAWSEGGTFGAVVESLLIAATAFSVRYLPSSRRVLPEAMVRPLLTRKPGPGCGHPVGNACCSIVQPSEWSNLAGSLSPGSKVGCHQFA